jgi:hypothetical protein
MRLAQTLCAFVALMASACVSSAAGVTYKYSGKGFTDYAGNYSERNRVTVTIKLNEPLPANLCNGSSDEHCREGDISSRPGFALQISDGFNTLDWPQPGRIAFISTGPYGEIVHWFIEMGIGQKNGVGTKNLAVNPFLPDAEDSGFIGPGGGGIVGGGRNRNMPGLWGKILPLPQSGSACNGIYEGTIAANLTVFAGQTCVILGGKINGNVSQTGGSLALTDSEIAGNVQISGPSSFSFDNVVIKGKVDVNNLTQSVQGTRKICGSSVTGDFSLYYSSASVKIGDVVGFDCGTQSNNFGGDVTVINNMALVTLANNTVGNNAFINNNNALITVLNNKVTRTLSCAGNRLSPTGSGNTAASKQGECTGL